MDTGFTKALDKLLRLRSHYEDLRIGDGPHGDRAEVLHQLHAKRAEMAVIRALS